MLGDCVAFGGGGDVTLGGGGGSDVGPSVLIIPFEIIRFGCGCGGNVEPFTTGFGEVIDFGVKLSSIFGGGMALPV